MPCPVFYVINKIMRESLKKKSKVLSEMTPKGHIDTSVPLYLRHRYTGYSWWLRCRPWHPCVVKNFSFLCHVLSFGELHCFLCTEIVMWLFPFSPFCFLSLLLYFYSFFENFLHVCSTLIISIPTPFLQVPLWSPFPSHSQLCLPFLEFLIGLILSRQPQLLWIHMCNSHVIFKGQNFMAFFLSSGFDILSTPLFIMMLLGEQVVSMAHLWWALGFLFILSPLDSHCNKRLLWRTLGAAQVHRHKH